MKLKIFAEFGIGNATLFSTEAKKGKQEKRVAKFILPPKIDGVYLWIYKFVIALSTNRFVNWHKKSKVKFLFRYHNSVVCL